MNNQGNSSTNTRTVKLRFGIRSLLVLVAVVALLLGITPKLWKMYRVHRAFNVVLATEWGRDEWGERFGLQDVELLTSDRDRTVGKLLEVLRSDEWGQRRLNAERLYSVIQTQPCNPSERKKRVAQMIDVACSSLATTYESNLLGTIEKWSPLTGISSEERTRIRSTALAREWRMRVPWIEVLASIGGREEMQLLLDFADEENLEQRRFVIRRVLSHQMWKGLVPYFERWLQDPSVADEVLESFLLSCSTEGRSVMIRFVADPSIPEALRRKGMQRLLSNVAGVEQLIAACVDPAIAEEIEKLVGPNSLPYLEATREIILGMYDANFWQALFESLDIKPQSNPSLLKSNRRSAELSLELLKTITGVSDLESKAEWETWKETHEVSPITQEAILRLLIERPELIEATAVLKRISPYQFGEIPVSCQPLYDQLLRSKNPGVRFWVSTAMLKYSESPAAADVAIDLAESFPNTTVSNSGAILFVQQRFAVNFFLDFKAWREWREKEFPN